MRAHSPAWKAWPRTHTAPIDAENKREKTVGTGMTTDQLV
jgi:hypothetical protein